MKFRSLFSLASSRKPSRRKPAKTNVVSAECLESRQLLTAVFGDFNGDSYSDLAVGVPGENTESGAINVIYGSSNGLSSAGDEFIRQGAANVQDTAEAGDRFGEALAAGDFNGDGIADLAIGIPGEDVGPIVDAGAVAILYGREGEGFIGNTTGNVTGNQFIHQDSPGMHDSAERFDRFGSALTTGDFNGDGYTDLAIGIPGENKDGLSDVGAVQIVFGSADGIVSRNRLLFQPDGTRDEAEQYDFFGSALDAGDLNGDGVDDLVVGVPGEDLETAVVNPDAGKDPSQPAFITKRDLDTGAIQIFFGQSGSGLQVDGNRHVHQDSYSDAWGVAEDFDYFGSSIAVGDLNDDGLDDIAIGTPGENVGTTRDAGAVHVLYSGGTTSSGTTVSPSRQFWTQNSLTSQTAERNDLFGSSLAIGDFDGDGDNDLAVGSPGEDLGTLNDAGAVHVIKSAGTSGARLSSFGNRTFTQNESWNNDSAEKSDAFGSSLATGDVNHDGRADLAITVPGEDVGSAVNAGGVAVFRGTWNSNIFTTSDQFWTQTSTNIEEIAEAGDSLGGRLPVGLETTGLAVPRFESNPNAKNTIFLDFDGHDDHFFGKPINTPAFDFDFDETTFSITELAMMQDIWDTITEDFAPFDVNVTTIAPGDIATTERIAFGGKSQDNFLVGKVGPSGVSPLGAFTNPLISNTAYVFTRSIFHQNITIGGDWIGSVGSHEAGHGFGLTHKSDIDANGEEILEYSQGGDDWTPIMGQADQRSIWTQASMDHPTQDGVKIVGSDDVHDLQKVLGLRADDHGNAVNEATELGTLTGYGKTLIDTGVIERTADHDVFVFQVSLDGSIRIDLQVNDVNPNLDLILTFGNAETGAVLETVNDLSQLGAFLQTNVSPGRYFVQVNSARNFVGDLGQYTLRVEMAQLTIEGKPGPVTTNQYGQSSLLTTRKTLNVTKKESKPRKSNGKLPYFILPKSETVARSETRQFSSLKSQKQIRKSSDSQISKQEIQKLDALFAGPELDLLDNSLNSPIRAKRQSPSATRSAR
ncbi:MAG: hypothetical protein Tsb009_15250 [Planctomycetaceae bacterium]